MIEKAKNKMMDTSASNAENTDNVTIRAVSGIKNEYHFPGSGKWKPTSIVASTIEEATSLWQLKREPQTPAQEVTTSEVVDSEEKDSATVKDVKVEEDKETVTE